MTAVALAHLIIQQGGNVLGVVADSGVPGSQPALPASVPISLFACRRPWEFWHCGMIERVWRAQGYTVNFIHEAGYSNYAFFVQKSLRPGQFFILYQEISNHKDTRAKVYFFCIAEDEHKKHASLVTHAVLSECVAWYHQHAILDSCDACRPH